MSEGVVAFPGRGRGPEEFERTPPQDVEAEQSVLGGMLMSKDAIADVVEVLRATDFYRPAHQTIYDIILDLYGRGEPADAVTVSNELVKAGELVRVGGAPYLHTLLQTVPTAANAGWYAKIVAEKAVLRRLVEAGTRIVQFGYGAQGDVDEVVDRAQQAIYEVTERRSSEDYTLLEELMQPTMDELEAIGSRGGAMTGVPTGFADLDSLTNGLHPGQLIVLAGRPGMGKSTAGLDIARSCSIKNGMTSAIFSLEMGKTEITMRLLSAEARVPLQHMRGGGMTDDDWTRLARRMGEVAEAPLFIDDSPNLTMMEIRAKARRLRQRHDLRLVVIDYLQLMSGNKKAESRQQEVSELSRSLKLLAKELEVPVIAMSQLNRGPEQRTDKKPQLSDLRESGCLPASTRVLRADNGQEVTLGQLHASGARDVPVWSLDDSLRYVRRHLTHVFCTGTRQLLRLTLASGKQVRATANHPFLTYDGWQPLGDLAPGSRVAVARHVPAPARDAPAWPDGHVVLLAHLLGSGLAQAREPLRYASPDRDNVRAVRDAAAAFGVTAVQDDRGTGQGTGLRLTPSPGLPHEGRPPITAWLGELDLLGRRGHEKQVPAAVFSLPKRQIRLFLHHLFATDGSILLSDDEPGGQVRYGSASRRLCEDVARLLLRFGISASLHRVPVDDAAPAQYSVDISGREDQLRFAREIGMHGRQAAQLGALRAALEAMPTGQPVNTLPEAVWERVRGLLVEQGPRPGDPASVPLSSARAVTGPTGADARADGAGQHGAPGGNLGRVARVLQDRELELLATNDVRWEEVVAIEPDGREPVFDATVVGTHNFIADGVAVHNSIEQDADMVILLHREDVYERESPRAGEADFIVAKHRNGPTQTITVAFQGHYSRFVDMSQG